MRWRQVGLTVLVVWMQAMPAFAGGILAKKSEAPSRSLPLDSLPAAKRDLVRMLADKAVLNVKGPAETFSGNPDHYLFFLNHPDRAVVAWRRLGAKCVSITSRGQGIFGWSDDQGSDIVWECIHEVPGTRIWLADGKVRPAPLSPLVPVKGLVVLRHQINKQPDGTFAISHQIEMFASTDSKTATVMTKLLGSSAKGMAEQGMANMQMFFSALTGYLERRPEDAEKLLKPGE